MTRCRSLCRHVTLAGANALFFGGAIWLLTAGARVRKAGWLDIFEDEYPWFHALYVLLVILLSLLIATLAISGLYSVLFKRKQWVLLVYAATSVLTLAVCAFLVIEGGISLSTAHAWKAHAAIDPPTEARVEANFNTVYCLSQAAFVCTAAANAQWLVHFGSEDMRDLYLDSRVAAQVKQAMATERYGAARSLLALCEDEGSPLHSAGLSESVAQLCTWCGDIADLQSYVHLVSWANAKCPPSHPSALYCVQNVWLNYSNPESTAPPLESPLGVFATGTTPAAGQQSSSPSGGGGGGGGGYSDPPGQQPYASGGGGGYNDPNRGASNPSAGGVAASVMPDPPYVLCRKTFLSYWSYLSLWLLLLSLAMLVFLAVVIRVAWVTLRAKPDRYSQRHGRKPERRPLVQRASKPQASASTAATSNPATARRAPATTATKPGGALAKAKALFDKGKK